MLLKHDRNVPKVWFGLEKEMDGGHSRTDFSVFFSGYVFFSLSIGSPVCCFVFSLKEN